MASSRLPFLTLMVMSVLLLLLLLVGPHAVHATTGDSATPEELSNTLKFLQALAGEAAGLQSTWTGTSYCSWPGVVCTGAGVAVSFEDVALTTPMTLPEVSADVDATKVAVTSVRIFNKDAMVTGTLPSSWGSLTQLQTVDLHGNNLTGTLPAAWGGLRAVSFVYMDDNELSGPLPDEWAGMTALETLYASGNHLTGTLPSSWGTLMQLQTMDLHGNNLAGTLPAMWSGMTALETLELSSNELSGSLPASWGSMPALLYVFVTGNAFCGCVPAEWISNTNLFVMVNAALTASDCTTANACATVSPAPTTTSTTVPAARHSSGPKLTALWCVIGVVGGLLVMAGIAAAVVLLRRRRQRRFLTKSVEPTEKSNEPYSTRSGSTA